MSIIPKIVNNNDLPTFNSLMGSVSTLSLIFGPALGGLVMFFGGAAEVLLFDTLLFIISSIIISRLNKISDDLTPQKLRLTSLRSLLSGFKFIKESKLVFSLVFYAMLSNMGVAVTWILTPLIVKNLSLSSNYVGYVMSAIGLGSFIGMNLGPKIQVKYYHLACTINTLLFTIILFFWSHYSTSINRVFALAFLMGFFACLHEASFWTLLQRKTPKALFGRVFTSVDSLSVIGMIIGTFVTERFFNFNTNFSLLPFLIMIILWTVGSLTFFFARTKKIIEV
jgi:MFS family permease